MLKTDPTMVSLTDLDEKRIAIVRYCEGERMVLTGVGVSANDPTLGRVLRVELDEVGHEMDNSMFMIPVADIERLVQRDYLDGCDYRITLD